MLWQMGTRMLSRLITIVGLWILQVASLTYCGCSLYDKFVAVAAVRKPYMLYVLGSQAASW